jgi:hypothetical protein
MKLGMTGKKGNAFVVSLMVIVIIAVIAATVITGIQNTQAANTAAYNVTVDGQDAVQNFSGLLPVYGTLGIAVLLIVAVYGFAARR